MRRRLHREGVHRVGDTTSQGEEVKIRKFIASAAIAAVAAVGIATPAKAAWSDCGNYPGTVCLFAYPNWGLPIWRQYPDQINGCRNLTGFDNVTTMASNNTAGSVRLTIYQYLNCGGAFFHINSGQYYDLSGDWWNDKASSVRVTLY
jgi:hypothetical protein